MLSQSLRSSIAFSPRRMPSCITWLDALDGVTKDGSNNVSAWGDQSVSAHNATSSGANQPVWHAGGAGGQPYVQFNGSSSFMSIAGSRAAGDWLVAALIDIQSIASLQALISSDDGGGGHDTRFTILNPADATNMAVYDGTAWRAAGPPVTGYQALFFDCRAGVGTKIFRAKGGAIAQIGSTAAYSTAAGGGLYSGRIKLGSDRSGALYFLNAKLYAFAILSSPSDDARTRVLSYFTRRGGLI